MSQEPTWERTRWSRPPASARRPPRRAAVGQLPATREDVRGCRSRSTAIEAALVHLAARVDAWPSPHGATGSPQHRRGREGEELTARRVKVAGVMPRLLAVDLDRQRRLGVDRDAARARRCAPWGGRRACPGRACAGCVPGRPSTRRPRPARPACRPTGSASGRIFMPPAKYRQLATITLLRDQLERSSVDLDREPRVAVADERRDRRPGEGDGRAQRLARPVDPVGGDAGHARAGDVGEVARAGRAVVAGVLDAADVDRGGWLPLRTTPAPGRVSLGMPKVRMRSQPEPRRDHRQVGTGPAAAADQPVGDLGDGAVAADGDDQLGARGGRLARQLDRMARPPRSGARRRRGRARCAWRAISGHCRAVGRWPRPG